MPEPLGLHICFDEHSREIEILDVTLVEKDNYRIEETPIFNPAVAMGDIIRLKEESGIYYYQETVQKSGLKRYAWLLSEEAVHSAELGIFKQKITESQGKWEQIFGGLLVIHVPQSCAVDVDVEMSAITRRFGI
ncbi:DUF4265 domain-containing protein [Paenibacillus albidus]|uniref:DUF4265 domain-containing protein n=1 Tax=Paenibacillus albidus TaxID=2041023 RepID=UPI001BE9EB3B|nr:DUF4265 domain-containing protein [Paenibacillus albidus]MBT2291130.1 DUF4265 domain-containing protein [Paenibacillus albidus]